MVNPILAGLALLLIVSAAGSGGMDFLVAADFTGVQFGTISFAVLKCEANELISVPVVADQPFVNPYYEAKITDATTGRQSLFGLDTSVQSILKVNGAEICRWGGNTAFAAACGERSISPNDYVDVDYNTGNAITVSSVLTVKGKVSRLYYYAPNLATGVLVPDSDFCQSNNLPQKTLEADASWLDRAIKVVQNLFGTVTTSDGKQVASMQSTITMQVGQTVAIPYAIVPGPTPVNTYNGEPAECNYAAKKLYGYTVVTTVSGERIAVQDYGKVLVDGTGNPNFACTQAQCSAGYNFDVGTYTCKQGTVTPIVCTVATSCGSTYYSTNPLGQTFENVPACTSGQCSYLTTQITCNPTQSYGTKVCTKVGTEWVLQDKANTLLPCPGGFQCDSGNLLGYLPQNCPAGQTVVNKQNGVGYCVDPNRPEQNDLIGNLFAGVGFVVVGALLVVIIFRKQIRKVIRI